MVRLNQPSGNSAGNGVEAPQGDEIVVVAADSGCHDYFVAYSATGYYLLEWFGGHSPSKGDRIAGEIGSFGFKDVVYLPGGVTGRVWVDDYMMSKPSVERKYSEKCK